MTCPGCLIALAGFGEDPPPASAAQTLPTDVGAELLGSLAYVIGGPVVGSIVFGVVGAVAWSDHRVAGGALGLVGGGILGGLVGAYLAKRKVEAVLPELQEAIDAGFENSPGAVAADGSFQPPPGGWKIGPLVLPPGAIKTPALMPGNVSVGPLQLLGLISLAKPPASGWVPPKMGVTAPSTQKTVKIGGARPSASSWVPPKMGGSAPSTQKTVKIGGSTAPAPSTQKTVYITPDQKTVKITPDQKTVYITPDQKTVRMNPLPTDAQEIPSSSAVTLVMPGEVWSGASASFSAAQCPAGKVMTPSGLCVEFVR